MVSPIGVLLPGSNKIGGAAGSIDASKFVTTPDQYAANPPSSAFDFNKYPELSQENIKLLKESGGSNLGLYGSQISSGLDTFKTIYKNVSGQDPTPDQVNGYLKDSLFGAWNTPGELQYTDFTNLANNYISNNYDIDKIRSDKGKSDAVNNYGSVDQQIQSVLGRPATQDEKDHFGTLMANGTLDQYQFGEFLKQQPEYTTKQDEAKQAKLKADNQTFLTGRQEQDKTFQQQLSGQLSDYDKQYFGEQILPAIQQNFAKQGRSFDSSGFQNSATQSAQQQNLQRQQYLAGITASQYGDYQQLAASQNEDLQQLSALQYGGRQNQAYQDYANALSNQNNLANYQRTLQDQKLAAGTQRLYEQQDYNTQQGAYNQYLAKYGKRNTGAQGAIGGATAGAAAGASFGPYGAAIGGVAGGIGGYFGSQGGSY